MSKIFHSLIFRFIIVTLVFFAATSPIIVLFGPFGNLKRAVVGAIMRSRHPQYFTWLYNQEELNEILGVVKTTEQTQVLSFKPRTDSTLSLQKIETTRFVGYLLEIPNPQRIQVATAEDIQEKGDTTSRIAKKNNAVAAIKASRSERGSGICNLAQTKATLVSTGNIRPTKAGMTLFSNQCLKISPWMVSFLSFCKMPISNSMMLMAEI